MGNFLRRLQRLATGRYVWVDTETGEETVEHYKWHMRWVLDGVHSWKWWWVRRWGKLDCGCTRNPLTRRFVLYTSNPRCPHDHGKFNDLFDRAKEEDDVQP